MKTPHKHAAVIKAWADGAAVQLRDGDGRWVDTHHPSWHPDCEYRVKPETARWRLYLTRGHGATYVEAINDMPGASPSYVESKRDFIRWIDTEWQEVEV